MRANETPTALGEAERRLGSSVIDIARHRLDDLREVRPPVPDFRTAVTRLVVIASPFRGGTSLLTELLRYADDLLHFQAEMQPILRLAGWTYPENGAGSECITELVGDTQLLEWELGSDIGNPVREWNSIDWHRYAQDFLWRWIVQWPELPVGLADVDGMVQKALDDLAAGRLAGRSDPVRAVSLAMLKMLAERSQAANPFYVDVSEAEIRDILPDLSRPAGPHGRTVLEFAPLAIPQPWKTVTRDDVEHTTVITKTPVNVYKMLALQEFFPRADIRVIHLTRNPGAAISSYREAWLSPWFFNAPVDVQLRIDGYTDPRHPWSSNWWKLDFPPGWQGLVHRSLEQVCAAQWCASHTAVLNFLAENRHIPVFRLKYEDLIGTEAERVLAIDELAGWLGTDRSRLLGPALRGLTPMNSITSPRAAKWRGSYDVLQEVLESGDVRAVAAELGYSAEMATWP